MTAATLILLLVAVAVVGSYLVRNITFGTAPLFSLLIAGVAGALCIVPARLLPDPMWWPDFRSGKRDHDQCGRRTQLVIMLCAALFADLVLWRWVHAPSTHRPDQRASVAASLQVLVLVPIAGLQSSYLRALIRREDAGRERGYMRKQELGLWHQVAWSRLIGLGIPAGVLVLSMVGEVVVRNGLDHWTGPVAWKMWPLPVAFAGAWALLLLVRHRIKAPRHDPDTLDLPLPLVIAIIVATIERMRYRRT